jgi:hypothetical protein
MPRSRLVAVDRHGDITVVWTAWSAESPGGRAGCAAAPSAVTGAGVEVAGPVREGTASTPCPRLAMSGGGDTTAGWTR